jgi:hypothetical protein
VLRKSFTSRRGAQVHARFPENMEALKFLIHICSELQEGSKLRQYQAELTKLERFAAMQDGVPQPGQRQSPPDAVSHILTPSHSHANGRGVESHANTQGLGGGDLLPEEATYQAPGNSSAVVQGAGGQQGHDWDEELGADLLPGLD